eukprot:gene8185-8376_t
MQTVGLVRRRLYHALVTMQNNTFMAMQTVGLVRLSNAVGRLSHAMVTMQNNTFMDRLEQCRLHVHTSELRCLLSMVQQDQLFERMHHSFKDVSGQPRDASAAILANVAIDRVLSQPQEYLQANPDFRAAQDVKVLVDDRLSRPGPPPSAKTTMAREEHEQMAKVVREGAELLARQPFEELCAAGAAASSACSRRQLLSSSRCAAHVCTAVLPALQALNLEAPHGGPSRDPSSESAAEAAAVTAACTSSEQPADTGHPRKKVKQAAGSAGVAAGLGAKRPQSDGAGMGPHGLDVVLAVWLFLSPVVWRSSDSMGKVLECVAGMLRMRDAASKKRKAEGLEGSRSGHAGTQPRPVTVKQTEKARNKLLSREGITCDEHELRWLADAFNQVLPGCAVFLEKRAGQGVMVPEGWMHWVVNTESCFKIATEVLRPERAAACLHMQRLVRGHIDHGHEAYMNVAVHVKKALLQWHKWLKEQQQQ